MHILRGVSVTALCAGFLASAAQAQNADASVEIIVTAQKRAQDIQSVPFSLDAVSGAELDVARAGGRDILFLAGRSPSLYAEASSGRTFPRFYIRGLGNTDFDLNASQPVSLVYDEVVLENPILKGFPVFDLDRVEILRGPQGTLFGRNTPAGVIKFESAKPTTEFEGYGRVSYSRFNTIDAEGAISGPLAGDVLTARLSALYQRRDDFVDNLFTAPPLNGSVVGDGADGFENFEEFAGRLQFLLAPSDQWSALLNIHGRTLDGGSRLFRANIIEPGVGGLVPGFDRFSTAQDATQNLDVFNIGANLKTEINLGFGQLTSITAYEKVGNTARGDVDGGFGASFAPPSGPGVIPFPAESADNITGHDQITQEIRLAFRPSSSVEATAGAFYFYERLDIENLSFDTLSGGAENGRAVQDQNTHAWAIFGSARYAATERLSLQGGLRVSGEHKNWSAERLVGPFGSGTLGPVTRALDDVVVSGDASADFKASDAVTLYARYARGFRAPNVQGRIVFGNAVTTARTEVANSFEGGVKTEFLDGRARLSLGGFYYRTRDQQLTAVGGAGNFNQLLNAEAVIGSGFEADIDLRLSERFEVHAGASLNNTRINDEGLETGVCGAPCIVLDPRSPNGNALIDGNPLPQAPRWISNISARYSIPALRGKFFVDTDWTYRSRINFFLYESVEFQSRRKIEGGARAGYQDRAGWEISAFGRNITNEISIDGAIDFNNFSGYVNEPRSWGVEAKIAF